jgi:hypothetical protein
MDFLTQQEISGFKQDAQHGQSLLESGKDTYRRKIEGGLGEEMKMALESPEQAEQNRRFAKKYNKKKKWALWKENWKRIFTGKKE